MTGNPRRHVDVVKGLASKTCTGEPSLQNSLDLVLQSLRNMPPHASREVIVIMGSLTTCDPSDISKTIAMASDLKVRCSVINLSAEVRIYRELATSTGGQHSVILDDMHFKDLLAGHLDTTGEEGRKISTAGYLCPQCSAKYCELPIER